MKKKIFTSYLTIALTLISFIAKATPVDPPADPDPAPTPIDANLVLLAIVALVFAYYILNKKRTTIFK